MLVQYRQPRSLEFIEWYSMVPEDRAYFEKNLIEQLEAYPSIGNSDPVAIEVKISVRLLKEVKDGTEINSSSSNSTDPVDQTS